MMIDYILDTNICIYVVKKKPITAFSRFSHIPSCHMAISVITYGELLYGANKSQYRHKSLSVLNNFIALTQVIQIDKNVAKHYGEIKADLSKKGQIISDNDLWIAAHVRSLDATLVSNNLKEFERVQGLKTENWVE
nr:MULTISPECIES: type II toxin-antitoxin system VapC family toxin [sulfur-oxidizing symbionts]